MRLITLLWDTRRTYIKPRKLRMSPCPINISRMGVLSLSEGTSTVVMSKMMSEVVLVRRVDNRDPPLCIQTLTRHSTLRALVQCQLERRSLNTHQKFWTATLCGRCPYRAGMVRMRIGTACRMRRITGTMADVESSRRVNLNSGIVCLSLITVALFETGRKRVAFVDCKKADCYFSCFLHGPSRVNRHLVLILYMTRGLANFTCCCIVYAVCSLHSAPCDL